MTTRADLLKGAAALMALPFLPRRATARTTRPNILFILTDDQPPHTVSRMANARRLIGEPGLDLTKTGYVAVPMCGPARVCLLVGNYPHNNGTRTNEDPTPYNTYRTNNYVGRDMVSRLKRVGYRTGYFGKFINGYGEPTDPTDGRFVHPNADRWFALVGGQAATPYRVNDDGVIRKETKNHSALFEDKAEAFVRAPKPRPWFCYLNFTDPHDPHTPPPKYAHAHDGARYTSPGTRDTDASDNPYARGRDPHAQGELDKVYEGTLEELELVDARIGRICEALKKTGQMSNTLIFFSSDNGYMLGEHGGLMRKSYPYEESVRVPFLVRGPGIPTSVPTPTLVSHLDITRTILAAAGANLSGTDGRDLRNMNSRSWRKRLLIEHPGRGWSAVREGYKMLFDIDGDPAGDEYYRMGPGEDPYQRHSLHDDPAHGEEVVDLAAMLRELRTAAGEKLRALEVA